MTKDEAIETLHELLNDVERERNTVYSGAREALAALRAAPPAPDLAERLERAETALAHVRQQAGIWKQEARTQKATVDGVGAVVGLPDYGPIVDAVKALRERADAAPPAPAPELVALVQQEDLDPEARRLLMTNRSELYLTGEPPARPETAAPTPAPTREQLASIEWSATGSYQDAEACPACKADVTEWHQKPSGTHKPDCWLAAALSSPVGETPAEKPQRCYQRGSHAVHHQIVSRCQCGALKGREEPTGSNIPVLASPVGETPNKETK